MTNTKENVQKYMIQLFDEKYEIGENEIDVENNVLHNDYGLDSLDCVEICMDIEKEFNTAIPDTMMEDWSTMTIRQIAEQVASIG